MMEKPQKGRACLEDPQHHILLLQGCVGAVHSNLKFDTRKKGWSYVAEHWQDGEFSFVGKGLSTKLVEQISLYQQLGPEFFRPKRLEFAAQGFSYNSLGSVKKVGQSWELEIKGADEPNRPTILLDSHFKLLAVTKNPATH
jgi:hypothetical protein